MHIEYVYIYVKSLKVEGHMNWLKCVENIDKKRIIFYYADNAEPQYCTGAPQSRHISTQ